MFVRSKTLSDASSYAPIGEKCPVPVCPRTLRVYDTTRNDVGCAQVESSGVLQICLTISRNLSREESRARVACTFRPWHFARHANVSKETPVSLTYSMSMIRSLIVI